MLGNNQLRRIDRHDGEGEAGEASERSFLDTDVWLDPRGAIADSTERLA